jgi:hypothetical protein
VVPQGAGDPVALTVHLLTLYCSGTPSVEAISQPRLREATDEVGVM